MPAAESFTADLRAADFGGGLPPVLLRAVALAFLAGGVGGSEVFATAAFRFEPETACRIVS